MDLTDDDDDHFNTHTLRIVKRFFFAFDCSKQQRKIG